MKEYDYLIRYRITRIIQEGFYKSHKTTVESIRATHYELRSKIDSLLDNGLEIIGITKL